MPGEMSSLLNNRLH